MDAKSIAAIVITISIILIIILLWISLFVGSQKGMCYWTKDDPKYKTFFKYVFNQLLFGIPGLWKRRKQRREAAAS